jgi:MATE family multidrug resistance protein
MLLQGGTPTSAPPLLLLLPHALVSSTITPACCTALQAFGAKDYKSLGLVLQRAMLVCWAACVPIVLGLMNSEPLLLHAGQQPEIAAGAAQYLRLLLPCLFTSTASECLRKYLLSQQVVRPTMIATALVTAVAPLYYWTFVCK